MTRTLYLTEPGLMLRRSKEALVIEREGVRIKSISPRLVGRVLLWRGAGLTTPALRLLLEHGIDVAFFSRGRYLGAVTPPLSTGVVLRLAQARRYFDPVFSLEIARSLIRDKCQGQVDLLRDVRARGGSPALTPAIESLEAVTETVMGASDFDRLRGIEGAAARTWFEAFASLVPPPLTFSGRSRRPPRDPVNAMLSLGYMLLTHEVNADVQARGFDPRLGFFHTLRAGRPALALDLIEPWRSPLIDRMVLTLLRRRQFAAEDFREELRAGDERPAVLMTPDALRRFLDAYELHMGSHDLDGQEQRPSRRRLLAAWIDGFEARLTSGLDGLPGREAEPEDVMPTSIVES